MQVFQGDNTITVTQIIFIDHILNAYQMCNCNFSSISIVKSTNLATTSDDYLLNTKDVSAYKQFIKSVQ